MSTTYLFPSTLKGLADVSVSPAAGQSGYPLTWNNTAGTTGRWQASNNIAGVTIRAGVVAGTQAIGSNANSSGGNWIAQGVLSGEYNSTGVSWMAQGALAGYSNDRSFWMAQGPYSGVLNTVGDLWVAQGPYAGYSNRVGVQWTAQGPFAGYSNTEGSAWIAKGPYAGYSNTQGSSWIALGPAAGYSNTQGSSWIALGGEAGYYDTRSNVLNIGNSRSKSLICGNFATDCIYFGHADTITSSATVPTPTAAVHAAASTTARASLRIDAGIPPASPFPGDVWVNIINSSPVLNFQVPLVSLQGTQVLATRRTGWTAPTGTATRTAFDTSTATTQQLAERLKALIDDLITHGLIGA